MRAPITNRRPFLHRLALTVPEQAHPDETV